MSRIVSGSLLPLLLLLSFVVQATPMSDYTFSEPGEVDRFRVLFKELRCLVCQNQTLADSDAPLAQDLREQVYRMMQDNQDDAAIIGFMVERYGDFVLYRPPFKTSTLVLWIGPFVLMLGGATILILAIGRRNRNAAQPLSADDQQRLERRLKDLSSQDNGKS